MRQVFENRHYRRNTALCTIVTIPFLLHVNILKPRLTEERKRYVVIASLSEEKSDSEISAFLKTAWSLLLKVIKNLPIKLNLEGKLLAILGHLVFEHKFQFSGIQQRCLTALDVPIMAEV